MATGDVSVNLVDVPFGGTGSARGRAVEIEIEGRDSANITHQPGDELAVTYTITREGYDGTTLGTTAISGSLYYVSATGAHPAVITAYADDGFFDDDADLVFACPANGIDGLATYELSGHIPGGSSARDYPVTVVQLAGIIDSNGDITPEHGRHTGTITVEAVAFAPYPIAAVTIELDDGTTTQTQTITEMTRSDYDPAEYCAALVANGWTETDAYEAVSGGSYVYRATFDLSEFDDGVIDGTITAYPTVGDADAATSETFDFLNDDGGSQTLVEYWCDNQATLPISGSPSAATPGMIYIGDTSGAAIAYRSDDGSTMRCCLMTGTPESGGEGWTAAYNADTFTSTGAASVAGDDTGAGTEGDPFQTLEKMIGVLSGQNANRVIGRIKCDGVDPVYHAHGRVGTDGVGVTPDQWQVIQPDVGMSRANVVVYGNPGTLIAGADDPRCNRLAYHDCTLWLTNAAWSSAGIATFKLRSSNDSRIWFHRCIPVDPRGHYSDRMDIIATTATERWYVTESPFGDNNTYPLGWGVWARNVSIQAYESDVINNARMVMEAVIEGDGTVINGSAHPDVVQQNDDSGNWVLYNVWGLTHILQLLQLTGLTSGAVVNYACLSTDAASASSSNLGNASNPHTVTNLYLINCSMPQSDLLMRSGDGDEVQENIYVIGVVAASLPWSARCVTLRGHQTDPGQDAVEGLITTQSSGSPFEGGLAYDDDATANNRNLRPTSGSDPVDRVAAGEVLVGGDALFATIETDGTGAIGALQVAAVDGRGDAALVSAEMLVNRRRRFEA